MDLFLLHGALGASQQFDALADVLSRSFRVHRFDFEGHGSSTTTRPFRIQYFGDNVIDVMNRTSIASAVFFGYSMGGYVALHLAATRPHLVHAVATLGTKFRWDPETAAREAGRLDAATIRAKVPKFASTLEERHAGAGGWETVLTRTSDLLRSLGDSPPLTNDVLRSITQPVHVLVGDKDNTVTREECAGVVEVLPNASLSVLSETAHPIEHVNVEMLAAVLTTSFTYR